MKRLWKITVVDGGTFNSATKIVESEGNSLSIPANLNDVIHSMAPNSIHSFSVVSAGIVNENRSKVNIKVLNNTFPECWEITCPSRQECANHSTAGDYRTEDGATPDLKRDGEDWFCSKEPGQRFGAIMVDGSLASSLG